MKKFRVGDKVEIKDIPKKYKGSLKRKGIVVPIGGFGYPDDDVMVKLENGEIVCAKERQLIKT